MKNPLASLRLATAVRYWHSARIVLTNQFKSYEYMEPVGYLTTMSIELALKAHLMDSDVTEQKLRKAGHDLQELLKLSIAQNLMIEKEDCRTILMLNAAHLKHFLRYGPTTSFFSILLVDEQASLAVAARLIDEVSFDPDILRKNFCSENDFSWPLSPLIRKGVNLSELDQLRIQVTSQAHTVACLTVPKNTSAN